MTVTRYYFSNQTAFTPPANLGAWDAGTPVVGYIQPDRSQNGAVLLTSYSESTATNNWDVLLGVMVSDALATAKRVTLQDGVFIMGENNTLANGMPHVHAYAIDPATGTVRGTFVNNWVGSVEVVYNNSNGSGRAIPFSTIGSPVDMLAGDRIVIEIGIQAQNTATTLYYLRNRIGGNTFDAADGTTYASSSSTSPWLDIDMFDPPSQPDPIAVPTGEATVGGYVAQFPIPVGLPQDAHAEGFAPQVWTNCIRALRSGADGMSTEWEVNTELYRLALYETSSAFCLTGALKFYDNRTDLEADGWTPTYVEKSGAGFRTIVTRLPCAGLTSYLFAFDADTGALLSPPHYVGDNWPMGGWSIIHTLTAFTRDLIVQTGEVVYGDDVWPRGLQVPQPLAYKITKVGDKYAVEGVSVGGSIDPSFYATTFGALNKYSEWAFEMDVYGGAADGGMTIYSSEGMYTRVDLHGAEYPPSVTHWGSHNYAGVLNLGYGWRRLRASYNGVDRMEFAQSGDEGETWNPIGWASGSLGGWAHPPVGMLSWQRGPYGLTTSTHANAAGLSSSGFAYTNFRMTHGRIEAYSLEPTRVARSHALQMLRSDPGLFAVGPADGAGMWFNSLSDDAKLILPQVALPPAFKITVCNFKALDVDLEFWSPDRATGTRVLLFENCGGAMDEEGWLGSSSLNLDGLIALEYRTVEPVVVLHEHAVLTPSGSGGYDCSNLDTFSRMQFFDMTFGPDIIPPTMHAIPDVASIYLEIDNGMEFIVAPRVLYRSTEPEPKTTGSIVYSGANAYFNDTTVEPGTFYYYAFEQDGLLGTDTMTRTLVGIDIPLGTVATYGYPPNVLDVKRLDIPTGIAVASAPPATILDVKRLGIPFSDASGSGLPAIVIDRKIVAVPVGEATASGSAPIVGDVKRIDVPVGAGGASGYTPTVTGRVLYPTAGEASAHGYAPFALGQGVIGVPVADAIAAGFSPLVGDVKWIAVPVGTADAQGYGVAVIVPTIALPDGSAVAAGYAPLIKFGNQIVVPAGDVIASGYLARLVSADGYHLHMTGIVDISVSDGGVVTIRVEPLTGSTEVSLSLGGDSSCLN